MLTPTNGIQKVTGLAAGQVVLTATALDQTAKVGFMVTVGSFLLTASARSSAAWSSVAASAVRCIAAKTFATA